MHTASPRERSPRQPREAEKPCGAGDDHQRHPGSPGDREKQRDERGHVQQTKNAPHPFPPLLALPLAHPWRCRVMLPPGPTGYDLRFLRSYAWPTKKADSAIQNSMLRTTPRIKPQFSRSLPCSTRRSACPELIGGGYSHNARPAAGVLARRARRNCKKPRTATGGRRPAGAGELETTRVEASRGSPQPRLRASAGRPGVAAGFAPRPDGPERLRGSSCSRASVRRRPGATHAPARGATGTECRRRARALNGTG